MSPKPRSSRPKRDIPILQIILPPELQVSDPTVKLDLIAKDFGLSWMEYFQKHNTLLFTKIQTVLKRTGIKLMDKRLHTQRRVWTLNNKVSEFLDSFERNRQEYNAKLVIDGSGRSPIITNVCPNVSSAPNGRKQQGNNCDNRNGTKRNASPGKRLMPPPSSPGKRPMPPPSSPGKRPMPPPSNPGPSGSRESQISPSKRVRFFDPPNSSDRPGVKLPTSSSSPGQANASNKQRSNNKYEEEEEISRQMGMRGNAGPSFTMPRIINNPFAFDDDAASMANSQDSQDSQSDLIAAGVDTSKKIKPEVVIKMVEHIDDITMLRIQMELQKIRDSGKWMKLAAKIPVTANALQLIFLANKR